MPYLSQEVKPYLIVLLGVAGIAAPSSPTDSVDFMGVENPASTIASASPLAEHIAPSPLPPSLLLKSLFTVSIASVSTPTSPDFSGVKPDCVFVPVVKVMRATRSETPGEGATIGWTGLGVGRVMVTGSGFGAASCGWGVVVVVVAGADRPPVMCHTCLIWILVEFKKEA